MIASRRISRRLSRLHPDPPAATQLQRSVYRFRSGIIAVPSASPSTASHSSMATATALAVASTAPSVDLRKRELRGAVLLTEVGRRRFCFLLLPALRMGARFRRRSPHPRRAPWRRRRRHHHRAGGQPAAARRRDPRAAFLLHSSLNSC